MSFAFVEIEAAAKKAVRGAEYTWGTAEDAAKAARWLCEQGFDGVGALLTVLNETHLKLKESISPQALRGDWEGTSGQTCPLLSGTALSDTADFWAQDGKTIKNVISPMVILPFAASASKALAQPVTVAWEGLTVVTDGEKLQVFGIDARLMLSSVDKVTIEIGGELKAPAAICRRAEVSADNWERLNRYAHLTYAPDTEESRLKGAGAGVSDND